MQMNHQAQADSATKRCLYIAMAIYAMAISMLSGCSNSSETPLSESPSMNNPNVNIAELDDPNGELAKLVFGSDADDALYQCLLSAATASATTRGFQAYPVQKVYRGDPTYTEGIYANWCKTVGAGDAVDTDIESCRYLNGGFSAAGTQVLQLIAIPAGPSEDEIWRIELKSIKIPEQGSTDFKVEFHLVKIGDDNAFGLYFSPFDGETYNKDLAIHIGGGYRYADPDINLSEYYSLGGTVAEQKSLLASSVAQFRTTITTGYEALKVQVEQALNADSSLDADAKQAALDKAITEIDRRTNVIDQNADSFHRLLVEQFAIEECG